MYTDSVEHEIRFLQMLWENDLVNRGATEPIPTLRCPCCREGYVLTRSVRYTEGERVFLKQERICDSCGEKFDPVRIKADIFFHQPHQMMEKLETPFGDIFVWVNGQIVPFRCRPEVYEDEGEPGRPLSLQVIDIDLRGLKPGDEIFCGYGQDVLDFQDGDERAVIYACEDEEKMLGFCGYEPDDDQDFCFQMKTCNARGFAYLITADPTRFNTTAFYHAAFTSLAVSWINKADYENPELMTFLALIGVIE